MTIRFENIKPLIGSRVLVDRSQLLTPEIAAQCLQMLDERVVLVFPKLDLNDEEQLAFTSLLGERLQYSQARDAELHPDIYPVTLDRKRNPVPEFALGTFFWHVDGITSDIPPPRATLLSARRVAARGGQTEFANCFAAYEHLLGAEKQEIENARVLHTVFSSLRPVFEPDVRPCDWDGIQGEKVHPLVWTHTSGRKSLLIGSHAERVIDRPLPAGRALLARLLEWTAQPDFSYRHEWAEGDFVIWNNCGGLHRVLPYDEDSGRMMHRTSIAGTAAIV